MAEAATSRAQEDGQTVLANLRNLCSLDGDEKQFWGLFLSNIAALCRSSVVLLIVLTKEGWVVQEEYYGSEAFKPEKETFLAPVLHLAERAHEKGFAYERLDPSLARDILPYALLARVDVADTYEKAVIFLIADRRSPQQFNDIVVRTQLVGDIPAHYFIGRRRVGDTTESRTNQLLIHALEVAGKVMSKDKFQLACMTLVNELSYRFNCSRVSIGWRNGHYIRTAAISHIEDFKKQTQAVRALEDVFEEAGEQNEMIVYPPVNKTFVVDRVHQKHCRNLNLLQAASLPGQTGGGEVAAVVTCETQEAPLTVYELDALQLIVHQVVPWLAVLHDRDRWIGARFVHFLRELAGKWLGVEHSLMKLTGIVFSVVFAYLFFGEWDYRVEGSATLRTDSVSYISAPYDGMISDVLVHEGDEVKGGSLLLKLDVREIVLREAQGAADIVRYQREVEKSRATDDLADMKIAQSKIEEAQAGLEKVRYYLRQAGIKAPHDGVVVEGDSRKLLGSPVSKGDILLKIATVADMYVHVRISERDIDLISRSIGGKLILLSRPTQTFSLILDKLIPMAEVDSREGNVFILKAMIDDPPQGWWRPGMSGMVKIDAGRRKIIWILTHRLTDFIRMYFWW